MGEYEAKAIIIATGATHRLLGIENEIDLIGKGVHFCATCDGAFYKDKEVAVVGGGNTAISNAIYLSGICKKVYVIVRKDKLRCEKSLEKQANNINNIEIIYNANVSKLKGEELKEVVIDKSGNEEKIKIDGLFVSIGLIPNTKFVDDLLDFNELGYINSENCITDKKGIFVAGDCRNKNIRQLTTAVNDGTIAATMAIEHITNLK